MCFINCSIELPPNFVCSGQEIPIYEKTRLNDQDLLNAFHRIDLYHTTIISNDKNPKWIRGMHKTYIRKLHKTYKQRIDNIMVTYEVKQYANHNTLILDYK